MSDSSYSRWRPHPWHGLPVGEHAPEIVQAYIEITPFDTVKFEIDKDSGYLKVDRPYNTSAQPPSLYGFVPRTYCAENVHALCPGSTGGDLDPLDICVITERPIDRSELLLDARVVGGLQMIDGGEADDKIIAVLDSDLVWGHVRDIKELSPILVERLHHYFLTYKQRPNAPKVAVTIDNVYGAEHAYKVIRASMADYARHFPDAPLG